MAKPAIVVVEGDEAARATLRRELGARYAADYDIVVEASGDAALEHLRRMEGAGNEVALLLADHHTDGLAFLAEASALHPRTRRALLLAWGESRARREEVAAAFALRRTDSIVVKPTVSPDERFHRSITELLDEWWRLHGTAFQAVRVIGDPDSPRSHEVCDLLQRHDIPYGFYPSDGDEGAAMLDELAPGADRLPVLVLHDGRTFVDPTNIEVADALGARTRAGTGVYDVVVVGGGPAGLATAVYAESEGLQTALVEPVAMGGQAGTSSMIRNYLGFPRGISGAELAVRAFEQALLFGTEVVYGSAATSLRAEGDLHVVGLSDGSELVARTVVVATGVAYRLLGVPALEPYTGVGVFYGAAITEARAVAGAPVAVVGGGNSAGQAAVHLAAFAERVTILVRSDGLAQSMSDYLVTEIEATSSIEVRSHAEVVVGGGDDRLQWVDVADGRTGAVERLPAAALFVLIGAAPFTDWLPPSIERDRWGSVVTGRALAPLFETSLPGVFAVGDVRQGSVKRVASAAGEGSVCVRLIHDHLARLQRSEDEHEHHGHHR